MGVAIAACVVYVIAFTLLGMPAVGVWSLFKPKERK